ncbi:hypothetical protein L1987_29701 [Smallanthus sonchifolius]|uniref:Uncharacterized protein n=1 Tax=Smallanthus sonchifolius TaxID=185202 RepID=A0ACB9I0L7_9ASTR|nr:hypothetical protein L1987_29701 [Smallanthus sonchifolius]
MSILLFLHSIALKFLFGALYFLLPDRVLPGKVEYAIRCIMVAPLLLRRSTFWLNLFKSVDCSLTTICTMWEPILVRLQVACLLL